MDMRSGDGMRRDVHVILTQLSKDVKHAHITVKEGVNMHDEKALDALLSEFGTQT